MSVLVPMEKTVVWPDSTVETIKVDETGKIFLNGIQTVSVGLRSIECCYLH
jgi:hypothetical protein